MQFEQYVTQLLNENVDFTDVTKQIMRICRCRQEDINRGECFYWAMLAIRKEPSAKMLHVYYRWEEDEIQEAGAAGHVFIKLNDKYYDAMHPTGTSNINDILAPFYYSADDVKPVTEDELEELYGVSYYTIERKSAKHH